MPTRRQIHLPRTHRVKLRLYTAAFNALVLAALLLVLYFWQPPIRIITRTNPHDGAAMVWVPAGKFTMGTSYGQRLRDAYQSGGLRSVFNTIWKKLDGRRRRAVDPAHCVYLDGYWIYKYEVTVAQYRKFCRATGGRIFEPPDWAKDDYPIIGISWVDANAYAKWAGGALPTEAQWEKAARGTDERIYPWGNEWDPTKCVVGERPKPVGSYPTGASPYGVVDMAGNVGEWCSDWFDIFYYARSAPRNPTGPVTGTHRVVRGGSYVSSDSRLMRADYRNFPMKPIYQPGDTGFRCVVRAPAP